MSRSARKLLPFALRTAASGKQRHYRIGAVGIRKDGVIVSSRNSPAVRPCAGGHAEARLVRKLTPGSIVFVARVLQLDGSPAIAKPCRSCETMLRAAGVAKVYYTTATGFDLMKL